jgi:hypothetical protein
MSKFWKGILRVVIEIVLGLIKKKVEEKLEDLNKKNPASSAKAESGDVAPRRGLRGRVIRLLIIVIVGITVIGLTAWATKPVELPSDVIIIRPLPIEDNPYQKEYDELLSPTVMIETLSGCGSGVVIATTDEHGYTLILIASHVVGKYLSVDVTFYDYSHQATKTLSASVVITDTVKDLALLRVSAVKTYSAKLAKRDYKPYLFTEVWVVGCSLGLDPRPSFGHLCALAVDSWEVSAPVLPGNSGGPVYDAGTHELIGIAVWVRLYGDQLVTTMAGVVPIGEIYRFLDGVQQFNSSQVQLNLSTNELMNQPAFRISQTDDSISDVQRD